MQVLSFTESFLIKVIRIVISVNRTEFFFSEIILDLSVGVQQEIIFIESDSVGIYESEKENLDYEDDEILSVFFQLRRS